MQLEPCPFCGSTELEEQATGALEIRGCTYQSGWVECRACGAAGPALELTDAPGGCCDYRIVREAWNRRARPPAAHGRQASEREGTAHPNADGGPEELKSQLAP